MSSNAVSTAQINAHMPAVRRMAGKLHARLPSSVDLDGLVQAGRIAVWRAIESFDGRGVLAAHVARRVGFALMDYLRETHPAGRNGPAVVHVSDDLIDELASDDDPADEVQRREEFEASLNAMSPRQRDVVQRTLAGQSGIEIGAHLGVSASRVSQLMGDAVNSRKRARTPANFDPGAVQIRMGAAVPPNASHAGRPNRAAMLFARMPAGGSVLLAAAPAETLRRYMCSHGVRYATYKHSETLIEVWREPTAEQMAGRKSRKRRP